MHMVNVIQFSSLIPPVDANIRKEMPAFRLSRSMWLYCHVINGVKQDLNVVIDALQVLRIQLSHFCGEDCSIQICPRCTPAAQEHVVDVILGRTLADIVEDESSLSELLITLPKCGHVFTIETLDGICEMPDYYTQSQDRSWIDLKTPVSETAQGERKKPPVCPTCRSAITSPRYGRVYKSADLDILERNVISRMSTQLVDIQSKMDKISKPDLETKSVLTASTIQAEGVTTAKAASVRKGCMKVQRTHLDERAEIPLPTTTLNPGNTDIFLVSPNIADAWRRTVKPLMQLYDYAIKVAAMRPAHIKAWEASWSYLVEEELKNAVANPAKAPRNLNQFAMQMARRKVGQPQPRADKRFVVEAFWVTIKIRFILVHLACLWLTSAGKNKNYGSLQSQMWALFTSFLLQGCRRDANIAYKIAEESETRRQMTTSQLLRMRVDFELHQLDYKLAQESGIIREQRQNLADKALAGAQKADKDIRRIAEEHRKVLPKDGKDWLRRNFFDTAHTIRQEWEKLGESIRMESFYESVSLDEKMDVVKALNFTHGGHFYNCPNGHTFVITECGGATEEAQCPECNEPIGGRDHTLNATNTRAADFEEMARQAVGPKKVYTADLREIVCILSFFQMSFQGLISGSECAVPSNPLSQVLKHTEGDRSLQQLHQLPGTAPVVVNQQDVTLARQFFADDTQKMGPALSYMPPYASDLSRINNVVGGPSESWAFDQHRVLEESQGRAAWAVEFGTSQVPSPPSQTQHPTTILRDYQQRTTYMNPIGSYGSSLPMAMNFGFNMQPSLNVPDTIGKGKGKAREVDFEAAFAQVAASLSPAQEIASGIVEVSDDVTELEDAMKAASLETSAAGTDFKQVWDQLQNSDLPPPKEDVAKWEAEFNQLMSDQRDELDHDYGATIQNAWESGVGDFNGTNLGEQPLKFDAEGIPILGEYVFEPNNKYMDISITRSLLNDARALLEQNGSLSEAGLLLEAAIQKGELGEGGYEAWILLGETRVMDEREEAGMRSLVEGVKRAEVVNAGGAGMLSLAISFTNESYDRASHTMLLRWLRARYPSLEVPESTIQAMATHSSWDTHNRITELFLTLARSQHAEGVLDPDVQIGLGVLFYTNGEYDRAKDCFESALTIRPKDYTLWNRLGSCLSNGSKPEEALGAYQQALQLRPTYTRAIYNVGVACLNIGAHKEAAEHFLSALNLQETTSGDTSDQLWYTLRRSLIAMDRPDLAELAKPEAKTKIEIFRKEGFDF
ncbi:hypothetical protein C0995_006249 [Termitomyces sp. Mi166|nr:hypothetical protein C0995_006249 [Termitomyces sp. Mi166\